MRKTALRALSFTASVLLSLATATSAVTTKTIVLNYSPDDFQLVADNLGQTTVVSPTLRVGYGSDPDQPAFPYIAVSVLIGKNQSYLSHTKTYSSQLMGTNITMAGNPIPVSPGDSTVNDSIHVLQLPTGTYPSNYAEYCGTHVMDGYRYLTFRVSPFRYLSSTRNLRLMKKVTLNIRLTDAVTDTTNVGNGHNMREIVRSIVVNGNELDSLYSNSIPPSGPHLAHSSLSADNIEYLLVTKRSLFQSFEPLIKWKKKKGVTAKMISIGEIDSTYNEPTQQLRIKRCLQDYKQSHGTRFVLLGGDDTVVPVQYCYSEIKLKKGLRKDFFPTDLFYACFDNSFDWNANENDTIGELSDNVDYDPEIYLTRIPIRTPNQASSFTNRIINYESNTDPASWVNSILMTGTKYDTVFEDEGGKSDAHYISNKIYDTTIAPNSSWDLKYLFDTGNNIDSSYYYLADALKQEFSKGYPFVDVNSHGSITTWYLKHRWFNTTHASSTANPGYTVITTTACLTNSFDSTIDPCLSEAFIRNENSGIIAYFGSSRDGLYLKNSKNIDYSSAYIDKFYELLLDNQNVKKNFGVITTDTKQSMAGTSDSYYEGNRWLLFGFSALGDPETPLYTDVPKSMDSVRFRYEDNILTINTGLQDARVCIMSIEDWGERYYEVYDNVDSISIANPPYDVSICVTKQGYIPYTYLFDTLIHYVQNETFTEDNTTSYDTFWVGSSLTDWIKHGPVNVNSGTTTFDYHNGVYIMKDFYVKKNASFIIKKH